MKTHRSILKIYIILVLISLPMIIILDASNKICNIALSVLTSSMVAFLIELANYIALLNENKNKLYSALYFTKYATISLLSDINNAIENNMSFTDVPQLPIINSIQYNFNNFLLIDNDYYWHSKKNDNLGYIKKTMHSSVRNIILSYQKFSIAFNLAKISKLKQCDKEQIKLSSINEISLVKEAANQLLNEIEDTVKIFFTKDQLNKWIIENNIINNSVINCKATISSK